MTLTKLVFRQPLIVESQTKGAIAAKEGWAFAYDAETSCWIARKSAHGGAPDLVLLVPRELAHAEGEDEPAKRREKAA
jgi:hypothetical protein